MTFGLSPDGPARVVDKPSDWRSCSTQSAAFETSPGGFVVSIVM